MPRWGNRVDFTQARIVEALRKSGALVWIIGRPVDLLVWHNGKWLVMECKTPVKGQYRPRRDQKAQQAFIAETGCPVVTSPEEALAALGIVI